MKKNALCCDAYHGDCLKVVTSCVEPHSVKLAILDPPYNMGKAYDAYDDTKTVEQYLSWFRDRMSAICRVMHGHGALWLFINDGLVSEVDVLVKKMKFYKRSHVIWYYTFGQHHSKVFTPSHTHLLYYVRHRSKWTFNAAPIRVPSARQLKYRDKRANPKGRLPDNTWILFPEQIPDGFDPLGDTWLMSRVCGTFHERESHSPNQIPVPLMERIILSTSNPGDLVLDPFMGSGSAGVAAQLHGRAYIGMDVSKTCVRESKRRLSQHGQQSKEKKAR